MKTRTYRYAMFGLLYFVQGAGLAYFRNFQKPYLDGFNIDADRIGLLTSILLLPFILKIFIGMLSDSVNLFGLGHRKPYIMGGLVLAAIGFGAAGLVSPGESFWLFAGSVLLGSFSVALFDSTTDGLAIDITPRPEQGTVQGVMVGGRAIGFILLSFLFGQIVGAVGYPVVFGIMAISMLVPLVLVWQIEEPADRGEAQSFEWAAFRELTRPRFLIFAAYALVYSLVSFGIDGLPTFFMADVFNAPETLLGSYGVTRGVGALLGAIAAGFLVDRVGRRVSTFGAFILVAVVGAAFALITSATGVVALGLVWGIAWGFQETVFVALAMGLSDSRIAASMFALMMAISNLGSAIGDGVGTALTDDIGFAGVFLLLAGLSVFLIPIVWGMFRITEQATVAEAPAR